MSARPYAPVAVPKVLEAPELVRELAEQTQPFLPVQRYFENQAQQDALNPNAPTLIAPNFRGDWAYDEPQVEGVEPLLYHEGFCAAARQVFGAEVVRPQQVYSNLTWQLPFSQGPGHTDVPAFRGVDRTQVATSWLQVMGASGLFESWRVNIATAVAWFYQGEDGGFDYWPDGPGAPKKVHEGDIFNTAIVGDNDFMFHRVRPVGARDDGLPMGMSLATQLEHQGGGRWQIHEDGQVFGEPTFEELRISVSWKAMVFQDTAEADLYDSHRADLGLDQVFEAFGEDLDRRGIEMPQSAAPLDDPALFAVLAETYMPTPPGA